MVAIAVVTAEFFPDPVWRPVSRPVMAGQSGYATKPS